jgi:hypothetical protein
MAPGWAMNERARGVVLAVLSTATPCIVTVQQLLGHSTVTVTMRYTHTNLDSKRAAVAKLVSFGDNLVTVAPKCSNRNARLSQIASNPQNTLELQTEEWVSG